MTEKPFLPGRHGLVSQNHNHFVIALSPLVLIKRVVAQHLRQPGRTVVIAE